MRNRLILAFALVCAVSVACAQAPPNAPGKTGVINVQAAIGGTKDGQKAAAELSAKFTPKNKEFEARKAEIAQLQDQLNKGGGVMAEDKRNQLARDIDDKKRRLERDMQDAEENLQAEQQKLLSGLGQRMLALIEKYSKDNGYSLILDVSNQNTPILFASPAVDITKDIVGLYDASGGAGGPAPAPATKAPQPGPGGTTPR